MSRHDFMGLCRDRAILCRDIIGQAGTILCRDKVFLGLDKVGQARSFLL